MKISGLPSIYYAPSSAYSRNGQAHWNPCKEAFLTHENLPKKFYFGVESHKTTPEKIIAHIHKLEDFLKIPHTKFKTASHTARDSYKSHKYHILELTISNKWLYNKITMSILLEALRGTFRKVGCSKLILALNKFGIKNYLEKKVFSSGEGWINHVLCNVLSNHLDENFSPIGNVYGKSAKLLIKPEFHKKG